MSGKYKRNCGGYNRLGGIFTKVYLTSPEPSKTCYNLYTSHPIYNTLTPLESSQLSRSGNILH